MIDLDASSVVMLTRRGLSQSRRERGDTQAFVSDFCSQLQS
jgi:hypothetical protein